jgi:hypothetical protein
VSGLSAGRKDRLTKGMCYLVAEHDGAHRSFTEHGVKLLIID